MPKYSESYGNRKEHKCHEKEEEYSECDKLEKVKRIDKWHATDRSDRKPKCRRICKKVCKVVCDRGYKVEKRSGYTDVYKGEWHRVKPDCYQHSEKERSCNKEHGWEGSDHHHGYEY